MDFIKLAKELKLQCLVEVHNQTELDMAVEAGADFVGINNRNLHTFETNLENSGTCLFYPQGHSGDQ